MDGPEVSRAKSVPVTYAGQANCPGGVVIGGDFQGLGIVRSLGRQGVPVCVIDDEVSISRYSAYTTHAIRAQSLRDEPRTIELLLDLGRRLNLQGWVLYPTRDETVAALSRHREKLSALFRVPTPDWECVRWAWDKRNTYKLAANLGIACPETWFPETVQDLDGLGVRFPAVLKPAIKEHFVYQTKVKAWRVDNQEELRARFRQAEAFLPAGELMIQELIPDNGGSHQYGCCTFFKEGRSVGTMVTHNVRCHPPDFGRSSTFVKTIDLAELEGAAQRILQEMGYYGLAEIEFRRDPRDGIYKLLDINARTWGYHSLGAAAGVDFPYMLFLDQMGKGVEAARARAGVKWVRFATDLAVGLHGCWLKRWGFGEYLQSIRGFDTEAVFDWNDPLPSMVETALIPYLAVKRGY